MIKIVTGIQWAPDCDDSRGECPVFDRLVLKTDKINSKVHFHFEDLISFIAEGSKVQIFTGIQ